MNIHDAVKAMSDSSAQSQGIKTLGEIRAALKMLPPETPVVCDNGEPPTALASYRGYYERLAIGTDARFPKRETKAHRSAEAFGSGTHDVTIAAPATAAEVIKALDLADGDDFEGYKGGQFDMHAGTYLHLAEYGDCGRAVVGVRLDGDTAVIETAEEEW